MVINNITDLRAEIALLKGQTATQEAALKAHFSSPGAIFNTIFSGFKTPDLKGALFNPEDLIGMLSKFILPFALNKTIFRNSGFLMKALVGIIAPKASGLISHEMIANVWDKVRSLASKITSKKKPAVYTPPGSATY